jgi:uncharacterized transporter YbjL
LPSIPQTGFQQFHTSSRPRRYCQKTQLPDSVKYFPKERLGHSYFCYLKYHVTRMGGGFEAAILTVVNLRQMGIKQIYARAEKGKIINVPVPRTVIYQGDILMVAGFDADLAKLPQE